jgi:hypothetical protein
MCSRKDPFRYLFFKFAQVPRKPEIWCLLDCLATTCSVRMFLSGMLSLHRCSETTWKLVQRIEMTGTCRSGVVTATLGARGSESSGLNLVEVVEPAAAVKTGGLI